MHSETARIPGWDDHLNSWMVCFDRFMIFLDPTRIVIPVSKSQTTVNSDLKEYSISNMHIMNT